MSALVVILIVLLLFGGVGTAPTWGYSRGWGWYPSGFIGVVLLILIVLVLTDRVHL